MTVVELSDLDTSLNFSPDKALTKALPVFCWRGVQLNGFDREAGQAIELNTCFAEAFLCANPVLSLGELSRAYQRLEQAQTQERLPLCDDDLDQWLNAYQMKPSSQNKRTLRTFSKLPLGFQNWCIQKKCKLGDLVVLLSLQNPEEVSLAFDRIERHQPSLSLGLQALELCVELALQQSLSELEIASFDLWLKELKALRYPIRHQSESQSQRLVKAIAWPARTQASWASQGDSDTLTLKIELKSLEDFENKLKLLEKVRQSLIEKNPWRAATHES